MTDNHNTHHPHTPATEGDGNGRHRGVIYDNDGVRSFVGPWRPDVRAAISDAERHLEPPLWAWALIGGLVAYIVWMIIN